MNLHPDWKNIVKKAYSFRLMIAAGLLSGAEVILPLFQDFIPRGTFAALAFVVTVAANYARVMQQVSLSGKGKDDGDETR